MHFMSYLQQVENRHMVSNYGFVDLWQFKLL